MNFLTEKNIRAGDRVEEMCRQWAISKIDLGEASTVDDLSFLVGQCHDISGGLVYLKYNAQVIRSGG